MKISEIINKITDDEGKYNTRLAEELYSQGINHYDLALAKWIGILKGKFKGFNGVKCGYCLDILVVEFVL